MGVATGWLGRVPRVGGDAERNRTMLAGVSLLAPRLPSLGEARPRMPALKSGRAITRDSNGVTNTTQAAGTHLVTRVLADTSRINGLGGQVDLIA